jgi:hypothetical protein
VIGPWSAWRGLRPVLRAVLAGWAWVCLNYDGNMCMGIVS